jgi:hypothetical protein
MTDTSDVVAFMIQLRVEDRPALLLALSDDGAITRSGSGRPNPAEPDVFIGQAPGPFFQQAIRLCDPSWLDGSGEYSGSDGPGAPCVLRLTFSLSDRPMDSPRVLEFRYGADSEGLPGNVRDFVRAAVQVTNDWYAEQLALAMSSEIVNSAKPWWKFW